MGFKAGDRVMVVGETCGLLSCEDYRGQEGEYLSASVSRPSHSFVAIDGKDVCFPRTSLELIPPAPEFEVGDLVRATGYSRYRQIEPGAVGVIDSRPLQWPNAGGYDWNVRVPRGGSSATFHMKSSDLEHVAPVVGAKVRIVDGVGTTHHAPEKWVGKTGTVTEPYGPDQWGARGWHILVDNGPISWFEDSALRVIELPAEEEVEDTYRKGWEDITRLEREIEGLRRLVSDRSALLESLRRKDRDLAIAGDRIRELEASTEGVLSYQRDQARQEASAAQTRIRELEEQVVKEQERRDFFERSLTIARSRREYHAQKAQEARDSERALFKQIEKAREALR